MRNIYRDKRGFYYFPRFNSYSLIALFGDRHTSLSHKELLESIEVDYQGVVCANQVHKTDVIEVDSSKVDYPSCDAMITKQRNLPLAIFTADCLPLFFYDPKNEAIGLAHVGWRGALGGITRKIVLAMKERFSTSSDKLVVGFGPGLRSCCYQVGEEFYNYFPNDIIRRTDGLYLDLIKINKEQLYFCGISEENILDSGMCTSCLNREFFSYRKEGVSCGRLISLMMLR